MFLLHEERDFISVMIECNSVIIPALDLAL